jgi:DNA mismatch repair ATPase MutS
MQTMAQQMRFHTRELTDIEGAARAASAGAVERESALFASLVSTLLEHTDRLRALAAALAVRVPFVVSSFATLWEGSPLI